ncbi:hypothetical protein [Chlamydiifrater volucris]|uniref:hypothetical protein n=1 Tax=Chlamydiifrater volucris TaxID=2681470 RepID=UPI0032B23A93
MMSETVSSIGNRETICPWGEKAKSMGHKMFWMESAHALCVSLVVLSALILIPALVFGVVNALFGVPLNLSLLLTASISGLLVALSAKGIFFLREKIKTTLEGGVAEQHKSWCPYVKASALQTLDNYERPVFQDPLSVAKGIIEAVAPKRWEYDTGVHPESTYERLEDGIYTRCRKELSFALLGFLTWRELQDLAVFCEKEKDGWRKQGGSIDGGFYGVLYVKCIKKYPGLVAAEAAFFAWTKKAFPYLGNAKSASFSDIWCHRSSFFERAIFFVNNHRGEFAQRVVDFFDKLSGFGALSLSSFSLFPETLMVINSYQEKQWGWELFSEKAAEYCALSIRHKRAFGDLRCFTEFMEKGSAAGFLQEQPDPFVYEKTQKNFFISPGALWDMGVACEQDAELRDRIEEGLALLDTCGYLGEQSVEEIKHFERVVLGLYRS